MSCEHLSSIVPASSIKVALEHDGLPAPLAWETAMTAFRLVQEALTNIARHAGVGEARVRLWNGHGQVLVEVADRGVGFDATAALRPGSSGLLGMRERVRPIGGHLAIRSQPGGGTFMHVCRAVPVPR